MATPSLQVQPNVVPDAQTRKEIENVLDLRRKLKEAIAELEEQRVDAKAELTQLLAKDLAGAPLSVDTAIARYRAWKVEYAALEAKTTDAKQLKEVIDALIRELKKDHPGAFRDVLKRLEDEAAEDKRKVERCNEEIQNL